ncbi:MAG: sigma-70 family RNA polymerase sigma factor [Labilithrix sp.]|nr:sigma-70 family RNA polymerase sigma factor [Labilithrix sp.]MCW5814344.1 sigma-70 family RNA polymerase sigma factor [Labilithrix sp.]
MLASRLRGRRHDRRNGCWPYPERTRFMAFAIQREILDAAVAGDSQALDHVLKTVTPHVERQLLRYPVSDEDRRDLLQTTLMQIVRRLGSFRAEASFSTWLFRVTANEALMLMRSRRRHRTRFIEGLEWEELATLPAMNDNEDADVERGLENRERDERVRAALGELPEDYRDVVIAHYHLDLGLQEIADRLAITESAVRSRLHRARSRLRTLLEKQDFAAAA